MIQQMLAIWSLVPLPFLKPAWISGSSWFMYCWSLVWRILSITLLVCEMTAIVWQFEHSSAFWRLASIKIDRKKLGNGYQTHISSNWDAGLIICQINRELQTKLPVRRILVWADKGTLLLQSLDQIAWTILPWSDCNVEEWSKQPKLYRSRLYRVCCSPLLVLCVSTMAS